MKCPEIHKPGKCNNKFNIDNPYCINCKNDGHPANYRNCPNFKEIQNRKEVVKSKQQEHFLEKQKMLNNFKRPELSYSKVVAPHTSQANIYNNLPKNNMQNHSAFNKSQSSPWDQACGDMFGLKLTDTLRRFQEFVPSFNAMTDPIDKKIALFEFFANLSYIK